MGDLAAGQDPPEYRTARDLGGHEPGLEGGDRAMGLAAQHRHFAVLGLLVTLGGAGTRATRRARW